MNYSDKIKLNNKIKQLKNKQQFITIYHIIKNSDSNIKFSKSRSGILFDLNKVTSQTLEDIEQYINNIRFDVEI
jgi:hypothetical protein